MQIKISCNKKDLLKALKHFNPVVRQGVLRKGIMLEINVKINCIELNTTGASFPIYCKTEGMAKVSVPLSHFFQIVKDSTKKIFNATFEKGKMIFDKGELNVPAINITHPENISKISLPINYNERDLLRLRNQYTDEELIFNNLLQEVVNAEENKKRRINSALRTLSPLGVTSKVLYEFVENVIFT
ncbi:MAG: hypothetical protein ABI855_07105 [Bacteroidota bacterium]